MELKNAIVVCLISLFSATLVVLIARSLDSQAASRLEPQLASIVEELQAIRKQGGIATSPGSASSVEPATADGLVVYYFHSNTRCPTCQSIESQAKAVIDAEFASQLSRGDVVWKVLNYELPANAQLAKRFDLQMPVVVLAKMKGGQVQDWKRLDEVWGLVGDKPAYAKYVRQQVAQMLGEAGPTTPASLTPAAPAIPLPESGRSSAKEASALPLPK